MVESPNWFSWGKNCIFEKVGGAPWAGAPVDGSGGFEFGGRMAAVFRARVLAAAFGGELAAGVLPALAVVIPVEAELGELAADFLGRRFREGNPNPLADDLGEVELVGQPRPEEVQDLVGGEGAVLLALL